MISLSLLPDCFCPGFVVWIWTTWIQPAQGWFYPSILGGGVSRSWRGEGSKDQGDQGGQGVQGYAKRRMVKSYEVPMMLICKFELYAIKIF